MDPTATITGMFTSATAGITAVFDGFVTMISFPVAFALCGTALAVVITLVRKPRRAA